MPDEALPRCIDLLLAAASGGEATTTKVRNVIATLERVFESDEIPPAEDIDRNELRIASTLNGRVVVRRLPPGRRVAATLVAQGTHLTFSADGDVSRE